MSQPADHRKPVRIIAFNSKNGLKTVNIVTSVSKDPDKNVKECLQLTAAQAKVEQHPTWQDSGGSIKNLPTIVIQGYAGPN